MITLFRIASVLIRLPATALLLVLSYYLPPIGLGMASLILLLGVLAINDGADDPAAGFVRLSVVYTGASVIGAVCGA